MSLFKCNFSQLNLKFQVFASNACDTDLKKLLDAVDQEVKDKGDQTVVVESRGFTKDLYFNPDCWNCPNSGCDEFGRSDDLLEHNIEGCKFRIVPCISEDCNQRIPEYLWSEHLYDVHRSSIPNRNGGVNMSRRSREKFKISRVFEDPGTDQDFVWPLYEHCHPSGLKFFPRFIKQGGNFYMYLRVIATQKDADYYNVNLEVKAPNGHGKTKVSNGKVYEVDMPWKDVIADGYGVLAIHHTMAIHYGSAGRSCEEEKRIFRALFTVKHFCYPIHDIDYYANEDFYYCHCSDDCRQKDFHNKS